MSSLRKGYLHLAMQSIKVSRVRSFMTMLGIVISVMSVILVVAIGEGVKQQIGNQSARYGQDVLLVHPSQSGNELTGSGLPGGTSTLLNASDLDAVRRTPGVSVAVPLSSMSGQVQGDRTINNPLVIASTPQLDTILNQKIDYGGFFTSNDSDRTAVLGADIARKLFSDNAPLGQRFTFRGQSFIVAGVFKEFTAAPFSLEANYNQAVFIPYAAAQSLLGYAPQINQMFVKVKAGVDPTEVTHSVQAAITEAHGGTNDVVVLPPGAKGSGSNETLNLLTRMTVGVALIALLLGGVGIMNMMLVSVTERIHEIGIRKAIGATDQQIMRQFMTEAFALSFLGSLIGLLGAFATVGLLRLYTSLQPVIIWQVAVLAPLIAIAAGVFFGAIPAIKAASMDPIEALRHE
jgi:putative ABC transport system permease protein